MMLKGHCVLFRRFGPQLQSKRFGDHDGGPRHHADAHNDPAMGPTLPARIREALESICPSGWWILEDGRDIYKVRGRWVYLYRAVDKAGQTVDFFLSRSRDVNAAKT